MWFECFLFSVSSSNTQTSSTTPSKERCSLRSQTFHQWWVHGAQIKVTHCWWCEELNDSPKFSVTFGNWSVIQQPHCSESTCLWYSQTFFHCWRSSLPSAQSPSHTESEKELSTGFQIVLDLNDREEPWCMLGTGAPEVPHRKVSMTNHGIAFNMSVSGWVGGNLVSMNASGVGD